MTEETPDVALPFSDVWRQMEFEIERLRAENEMLKALLTDEYERGFEDCVRRVEEIERKQADRLEERMKPIKDALYPGIYKPQR